MYLTVALLGWAVAQIGKYLLISWKQRSFKEIAYLHKSGGMPSTHTSTLVALLAYVGLQDGFETALFAVLATVTGIVIYDAINVRRSVGEQGRAIGALLEEKAIPKPFVAMGHTSSQVGVGALLGAIVGIVAFFITNNS